MLSPPNRSLALWSVQFATFSFERKSDRMTSPCDNSFVECEARPSWMSPRKRRSLYQAAVGTAAPPHRIDRKQVQLSAVAIDFTVPSKLQQELLDELSRAKEVADSSSTKLPLTSRFPTSIGLNMISAQEPLRRRGAQPLWQQQPYF